MLHHVLPLGMPAKLRSEAGSPTRHKARAKSPRCRTCRRQEREGTAKLVQFHLGPLRIPLRLVRSLRSPSSRRQREGSPPGSFRPTGLEPSQNGLECLVLCSETQRATLLRCEWSCFKISAAIVAERVLSQCTLGLPLLCFEFTHAMESDCDFNLFQCFSGILPAGDRE